MGRFSDWLLRKQPSTGRMVTEAGTTTNVADVAKRLLEAVDPFGPIRVTEYQPVFSSLPLPVSLINDRVFTSGGATIEYVDGEIVMSRSAGEDCAILTGQRGRYQSGLIGVPGVGFRREESAPTGTTTYYFGYFDKQDAATLPENGFGFKQDSDGDHTTFFRNGVEVYRKPRSEWLDRLDGSGGKENPSGLSVDSDDGFVVRFPFGYYGYMAIEYGLITNDAPGRGDEFVVVDRAYFPKRISLPYANLSIAAFITGDGPGTAYIVGRQYGVYGQLNLRRLIRGELSETRTVTGTEQAIISARLREESPWFTIPIQFSGLDLITTEDINVFVIIGGTLDNDGDVNWNIASKSQGDISTEFNTAVTTVTGGEIIGGPWIQKAGGRGPADPESVSLEVPSQDIPVGVPVTVVVQARGPDADVGTSLRIAELR